jgi:hypothetical protein
MKKIFICLFVLILSFQLINATETNITIKTVPFKNINIIILSSSLEVYDSFNKDADKYGDASFLFSSDKSRFDLTIFVKDVDLNKKIAYEKLENQIAGENIYVEVVPKDFTIIETPKEEGETQIQNLENEEEIGLDENISLNDSLILSQEESKTKSLVSGNAIFGEDNKLRNIILYVLGGIVLVLIIFFFFKKIKRGGNKKKKIKEIKVKKLSELRKEEKINEQKDDAPKDYYKMFEDTQKELEKTQQELSKVKNQERINEIERKIQRDQQELRKLKGF